MHQLSAEAVAQLEEVVRRQEVYPLVDGEVRLVEGELPGRAVVGVVRQGSQLWIILDLSKPYPYRHLAELMNDWPLGETVSHGVDDGVVETVRRGAIFATWKRPEGF